MFNSAYFNEYTFDCLEVEVSILGSIAAVHDSASHSIRWVALISLFYVLNGHSTVLFFLFALIRVGVD